jgi:hypothetical protein
MSKKIIVLNGSPPKGGNTDTLIEVFINGVASAGHAVNRFDLRDMNIKHCLGCQAGGVFNIGEIKSKPSLEEAWTLGLRYKQAVYSRGFLSSIMIGWRKWQ